jgi:hypothetical protein
MAGSPATLNDRMLRSPLVAAAETEEESVAATAARLKRRAMVIERTLRFVDFLRFKKNLQGVIETWVLE